MAAILYAKFTFTFGEKGTSYKLVGTNMTDAGVVSLLENYLHGIVGAGKDSHEAIKRDTYKITVAVDLSYDEFTITHDCGNLGLLAGILSSILAEFEPKPEEECDHAD